MRRPLAVVLALVVGEVALAVACGSGAEEDLPALPPVVGTFDASASASTSNRRFDGAAGDVRISILAPMADTILKVGAGAPEVRASVVTTRPGSDQAATDPIDPASVTYTLRAALGGDTALVGRLFGPSANAEFSSRLDLSAVPTGDYLLTVAAATQGGSRGVATISLKIDAGPRINIVSPRDGLPYKGSVAVQVVIDSAPFEPTAEPVDALVGTSSLPLRKGAAPNTWEGLIEFDKYMPPLAGEQVFRVSTRNAQGTTALAQVRFTIDTTGPTFTMLEPTPGSVVGGVVRVRARIDDPAGVLGSSVIAVIGNKADVNYKLDLKPEPGADGFFSELFDTRKLSSCRPPPDPALCVVFPNVSFRASDRLGNESALAYDVAVDNNPPILDLDPPPDMRISKFDRQLDRFVCSHAFDPVGNYHAPGDMPNDGCAVPQVFDLRARVQDDGNRAEVLKVSPIAGVDPATVSLFVLDDTSQPLVVDVDGDGVCDAINPRLVPTTTPPAQSNQVLAVHLVPVPPKGSGDFTPDVSLRDPQVLAEYPGCAPGAAIELAPPPLCAAEDLPVSVGYPTAVGPDSAIWGIEPVTTIDPWCLGSQFDTYANNIAEGWACAAAAATDRAGNASVSPPLRMFIVRRGLVQRGAMCPGPPAGSPTMPDCTGTYNRQTGTVIPTPCRARRFRPHEVIPDGTRPEMK